MAEESNIVGQLSLYYESSPKVRSLLYLLPSWGVANTLLQARANEIQKERLRCFFDELAKGELSLTDALIESEDFLHCYFSTVKAASNSRKREKIEMLAKILKSFSSPKITTNTDEYEELLQVLDIITMREFNALLYLRNHEKENPFKNGDNEVTNCWRYWRNFENQLETDLSIPPNAQSAFLAKIERSGLYLRITGAFLDYSGDMGRTTPLFDRLLEFIDKPV